MNNDLSKSILGRRISSICDTIRYFSLHNLPEEIVALQKTCRQFAENELKPIAAELDRNKTFPKEQV